jgi:hypothetical protein
MVSNCPKCKKKGFIWSIDEEITLLTSWDCRRCGYGAYEDERKIRTCSICNCKADCYMMDNESKYWWCPCCGRIEPIINTQVIQSLNIPKGWKITYNNFFDIDPLKIDSSDDILWENFSRDLLQIRKEGKIIILNLAWYPEMDPNGCFHLRLTDFWEDDPLILADIKTKSKSEIIKNIEKLLLEY